MRDELVLSPCSQEPCFLSTRYRPPFMMSGFQFMSQDQWHWNRVQYTIISQIIPGSVVVYHILSQLFLSYDLISPDLDVT